MTWQAGIFKHAGLYLLIVGLLKTIIDSILQYDAIFVKNFSKHCMRGCSTSVKIVGLLIDLS